MNTLLKVSSTHATRSLTSSNSNSTGKFSVFFASTNHLFSIFQPPTLINLLRPRSKFAFILNKWAFNNWSKIICYN